MVSRLQRALRVLDQYFTTWHIKANHTKTELLYVPCDGRAIRTPRNWPVFNGEMLQHSNYIRYLSVLFDNKLAYTQHIVNAKCKIIEAIKSLLPLILCKKLSINNRLRLAKCVIWPSVSFAATAWGDASQTKIISLRRAFSRSAKCCLRLNIRHSTELLYQQLKIAPLEHFIENEREKFVANAIAMEDPEIIGLGEAARTTWDL